MEGRRKGGPSIDYDTLFSFSFFGGGFLEGWGRWGFPERSRPRPRMG